MRGGVDEVGHGDEGCGEADGGTVQGCDEDLGMVVESTGDVHVVGDEVANDLATDARAQAGIGTGAGYICSAVQGSLVSAVGILIYSAVDLVRYSR